MPLYLYEHDATPPEGCSERFEVLQGLSAQPLTACSTCGKTCHRVIARFSAPKSTGDILSKKNLARKGFTQYRNAGDGHYEKTVGSGPDVIKR